MQRETFEKAVKDAIVRHSATERSEREKIYNAARSTLRRRSDVSPEDIAELDAAIDAIEVTFSPKEGRWALLVLLKGVGVAFVALLAGVVLGAGVASYIHTQSLPTASGGEEASFDELRQIYSDQVALIPEATQYIRQVVDVIVERQKRDRTSMEISAKAFIPLAKFDPEVAKEMPKSLPPGTGILVRADATNLKVLMNWTLCGVASISNPEMVDRKRTPKPTIGCPYFGLWTDGAANW